MICKQDQSPFTEEENASLLKELNSIFPTKIQWMPDGNFKKSIIFRTKNYVLWDGVKQKLKGSAVKAPAKEKAIREFVQQTIQAILDEKTNFTEIYNKYVLECLNVKDINRFATRKTLTDKTYSSERANETKIIQAIEGTEYQEGNRIWVYFTKEGTLKLVEHYNGDHDPQVLLKKLYMTSKLFDTVLPTKDLYLNYSLKKNQKLLESLGKETYIQQKEQDNQVVTQFKEEPECPGWREVKAKYPELFNKVYNLPDLLPPRDKTFRAFKYFKPKDCKVIIIGQDAYPNKEHANGLAFSSESPEIPASLKNIFKELETDLQITNITPNLEPWAKQGVLLLNSILSTIEGQSLAHKNLGWEPHTTTKIQQIIDCGQPLVILAWGQYAQNKLQDLNLHDKVKVITGAHPSPLAGGKFFGGKYFSRCNEWLEQNGVESIDWNL